MLNTIQQAEQRAEQMRQSWADRPRPIRSAAVLTPAGEAGVALLRARRLLLALSNADRALVIRDVADLSRDFLTGETDP
jgi:hypothetical protein